MGHDPEKWEPVFGEDHARSKSAPVGEARKILVPGASGLIGRFVTDGALVKTGPAIVLMLVVLLTSDNRWRSVFERSGYRFA